MFILGVDNDGQEGGFQRYKLGKMELKAERVESGFCDYYFSNLFQVSNPETNCVSEIVITLFPPQ